MLAALPFWSGQAAGSPGATLTAQVSDNDISASLFWNGIPPRPVVYTGYVTASPIGGTAPYTYLWAEVDGSPTYPYPSGQSLSLTTPATSATVRWQDDDAAGDFTSTGLWACTITDSLGATAVTPTVRVEIERTT